MEQNTDKTKPVLLKMKISMILIAAVLSAGTAALLCGCRKTDEGQKGILMGGTNTQTGSFTGDGQEPYTVKTVLKEESALNADSGRSIYVRYTETTAADDAPGTLKNALAEANRRAREAAKKYLSTFPLDVETYSYTVTVTRADHEAFSILETEYEAGPWNNMTGKDINCRFRGTSFDTASGEEIPLTSLITEGKDPGKMLEDAVMTQYGSALADTQPSAYSWTIDVLGLRFYFHMDRETRERRKALGDYSDEAISVAIPFTALDGDRVQALTDVPEAYIARMDKETVYDLPHGDRSVMLTKTAEGTVIRMMPDKGESSDLTIEYADAQSQYYIIRSMGGFYLFRERMGYQEGFFYDFSRPDGGYGRFAYNNAQYFDSFMREIGLALPYNPYCAHLCEVKRSFGEKVYDDASFVPHGHYSFPDEAKSRYKRFVLIDDSLQIDTGNTACRLLEDMTAAELDAQGNELGEMTVKAGSAFVFEAAYGEADRYQIPTMRGRNQISYIYDFLLTDGRRGRITSKTENTIFTDGKYLNRISTPISLAEAQINADPGKPEAFTVAIGGKNYPVIPDYTKTNHVGEEIDFGTDKWWQVEKYTGQYCMTDEDAEDYKKDWLAANAELSPDIASLAISDDGKVHLVYYDQVYEGTLPATRYYGKNAGFMLKSEKGSRAFTIILRDRKYHKEPHRIELYSEGLPATNMPSTQPSISIYLTKQ